MKKKTASRICFKWIAVFTLAMLVSASCNPQTEPFDPGALARCDEDVVATPRSAFKIEPGPVNQIANEISEGVGKVVASTNGSDDPKIIVFEETHSSRIGQLEIALMLYRLHTRHGLRQVSMEGAFAKDRELQAKWFHDLAGTKSGQFQEKGLVVNLLKEGEINSGEFIAIALPEVQVKGNEKAEEYLVSPASSDPGSAYLIAIAEKSLTQSQISQINRLVRENKKDEARDILFGNDSWVKERYDKLGSKSIPSTGEMVALYNDLKEKADQVGARVTEKDRASLQEQIKFFRTATKRSCTMVENTFAMLDSASKSPVALIVGAAHTNLVIDLLRAHGVSFAVVSPLSLTESLENGKLTSPAYKRKTKRKSVDGPGMLGSFIDGRHKPGSVLSERWFHIKSESYLATVLLARAAAAGDSLPFKNLQKQLESLKYIKVNFDSCKLVKRKDQVGVVFTFKAKIDESDPNKTVELAAGGISEPPGPPTQPGQPGSSSEEPDFERLLWRAIEDTRTEEKQDPNVDRGAKQGEAVLLRISTDVNAAFSNSTPAVEKTIASG